MRVAVFSDLHLQLPPHETYRDFVELLRELRKDPDLRELWLLGDILDILVGPFAFWKEAYHELFEELAQWTQSGRKVLWLEGNHDFFIEKVLSPLGVEVRDGEVVKLLGDRKVYLAHGDLVNREDLEYLEWRAFTRDNRKRRLLALMPNFLARGLFLKWAQRMSRRSRKRSSSGEHPHLREMYRSFAREKFAEGFSGVFVGHCHVADEFHSENDFYVNLGSALDGSLRYAIWDVGFRSFPKVSFYRKMKG